MKSSNILFFRSFNALTEGTHAVKRGKFVICVCKTRTTRIQSDAKNLLFDSLLLQLGCCFACSLQARSLPSNYDFSIISLYRIPLNSSLSLRFHFLETLSFVIHSQDFMSCIYFKLLAVKDLSHGILQTCNFSCHLQRNFAFKRCKLVTNV